MPGEHGRKKSAAGPELHGFSRRLNDRIDELGWSSAELARASRIAPAIVSRTRSGQNIDGLTCQTAIRLANALGMSLDWLLRGERPEESAARKPAAPPPPASPSTRVVSAVLEAIGRNIIAADDEAMLLQALQLIQERRASEAAKAHGDGAQPRPRAPKRRDVSQT